MARKPESAEFKAFRATLKGLPAADVQELISQYKSLIAAVAAAKARNEARKSLATLPTAELQAELERRKTQKPRK